jgi:predicted transcriptional regulator
MRSAFPAQAAAIAAAIEQFRHATAPPAISDDERLDPWIRAAILEGVTRDPEFTFPASG